MKRYRLLKDLPYVKAGAIYQLDTLEGTYVCDSETAQFTEGTRWDGLGVYAVEKAEAGWFEEIPDTPEQTTKEGFVWTDELVLEYAMAVATSQYPYLYNIDQWKKFKESKQSQSNTPKEGLLDLANPNPRYSFYPSNNPSEQPPAQDWEVVAYRYNGIVYNGKEFREWLKGIFGVEIFSVRRKDGVVFSVGEEVDRGGFNGKIHGFEIKDNWAGKLRVYFDINKIHGTSILIIEKLPSNNPSEQPKERKEVMDIIQLGMSYPKLLYQFAVLDKIPEEKFPAIKQAIESILNNDLAELGRKALFDDYNKKYTQEQLDKAIEEEREKWYNIGKGVAYQNSPSYQQYLSTIKNKQQ